MGSKFPDLKNKLDGQLHTDIKTRILYATDASVYREIPIAVALPKNNNDIQKIIAFASANALSVIPRTAGTSLAGQVVGGGIVVDVSRYMNSILELNEKEKWVKVQPGVILDDLNNFLSNYNLFFGPETSTSNRCMIGGMVGNNACGSHSIIYGTTRDHTISVNVILSDGSTATFGPLSPDQLVNKQKGQLLENKIYNHLVNKLSDKTVQQEIISQFPKESIYRRNTGYAVDKLLKTDNFGLGVQPFNLAKMICGSEGTLAFITSITLNLVEKPPNEVAVVAAHFHTREEAFRANLVALKHNPGAVEMMDSVILNLTRGNRDQNRNRFFVEGDPGAILIIEFARKTKDEINRAVDVLINSFRKEKYGYHFPVIYGDDTKKVWALRKAGLGVLSNVKGDGKPVSVIEDTAVDVEDLPDYMNQFQKILDKYDKECVYHAHIGSGELHLRPILNLKDPADVEVFHDMAKDVALLVKKFRGSMSGEHGDGRVRGEFIPIITGEKNYEFIKEIKKTWDPANIFNPGKIVDVAPMKTNLRYGHSLVKEKEIQTYFDFSDVGGILRATEKCNGSGDCRKTDIAGGTMCPSYRATRDENDVTRARANILREFLTTSNKKNPFDHKEIKEVMDLCLSCKACKSECPSSVDVAKLKAEFLQHYYDQHGVPLRSLMIAKITDIYKIGLMWPGFFNAVLKSALLKPFMAVLGFSTRRNLPVLNKYRLTKKTNKALIDIQKENSTGKTVYLFVDEFSDYYHGDVVIKALLLLSKLGYRIETIKNLESGRSYLSKGLVKKASKIAKRNVGILCDKVKKDKPLIGLEPSAILSFRDEYPELVGNELRNKAVELAQNALMIEEFLMSEMQSGAIKKEYFTDHKKHVKLHGHCQQKAVASTESAKFVLSFPENYTVEEIESGCCGMAGSFGYENEHYEVSMRIGEMVLFPEVRNTSKDMYIAAPGTSCRHQIKDGTGRTALHPVEIMYDALSNIR